jgi:hypothetical protein
MKNKLVLLLMAAVGGALIFTQCKPKSQGFIKVQGVNLALPSGEKFFIRGTNLGHWLNPEGYIMQLRNTSSPGRIHQALCEMVGPEFMSDFWQKFKDSYVTKADIRFLSQTGINTLRLPFHYKLFTDEDYMGLTSNQDGFARFDSAIAWCREFNLRLILDMHDAPAGQTGDNIDDSYGYPWLFESPNAQNQLIAIWVKIASRYAHEPVILGYDLMNEPIAPYFERKDSLNKLLEPLYRRAVEAIRKVDRNHVILLGGSQWNGTFEEVFTDWKFDDNIMYTCHHYGGEPNVGSIRRFLRFRDTSNLPMYMGETGENTDEWVASFRKTMEDNNIGWTFWPYKKLGNTRCFVHVPKPAEWDSVVVKFVEQPRESYKAIRAARPNMELARKVLTEYVENCRFERCIVNHGYVDALTKD